jgi:ParB family chromosome partitioning protein
MKKNETRDNIALSDIHVSEGRLRKRDQKLVDTLAESMREQGQLQPILLRHRRDGYELISGRHRLEAAKKLNTRVQAVVNFNLNNDDMLLAEIDENLIRGELDALERSEHMVKRKELYERKHPETKAGKSQAIGMNKALGHNVVAKLAPTFTKATAAKTGISERSIERDVARGSQTRLGDIKGTSLAKGIELDALAKLEKIDPAKRDTIKPERKSVQQPKSRMQARPNLTTIYRPGRSPSVRLPRKSLNGRRSMIQTGRQLLSNGYYCRPAKIRIPRRFRWRV